MEEEKEDKGIISIPINEVWELINKPHRFFQELFYEVKRLKIGVYEYIDFDKETKKELLARIKRIALTGKILK